MDHASLIGAPHPETTAAASPRDTHEPDLSALARLCTRLARVLDRREMLSILDDAARVLDAVGLVVWWWDPGAAALSPSLAHGYSDAMLARLPRVDTNADNAIAAAFRASEPCVVNGSDGVAGSVVVPLLAPGSCVGVLALELRNGGEQRASIRACAAILAAQLATLLGTAPLPETASV